MSKANKGRSATVQKRESQKEERNVMDVFDLFNLLFLSYHRESSRIKNVPYLPNLSC